MSPEGPAELLFSSNFCISQPLMSKRIVNHTLIYNSWYSLGLLFLQLYELHKRITKISYYQELRSRFISASGRNSFPSEIYLKKGVNGNVILHIFTIIDVEWWLTTSAKVWLLQLITKLPINLQHDQHYCQKFSFRDTISDKKFVIFELKWK